MRQFIPSWFNGQFSKWLEYSVKKDAAFFLCYYLFKNEFIHGSASEFYTKNGFRAWNKGLKRLRLHVGDVNGVHDKCFKKILDLSNHHQSIQVVFDKHSEKLKSEYQMSLEASIDVTRLLLLYGLPFRSHDKSSTSNERNQAKYLLSEIITFKFVFMLHLMLKVLAMSNELNKILPKRDQDIVNAMEFLNITKKRL
ncbi:uncharacterized protein LOC142165805 [Nicotiana tabacum]|uniref:Uncharacterized protein LOC142165805 n=1 Tax=Nicotiana tabacum TaxID=4097 RepID=A0AC58S5L9_TOBAC